MVGGGDAGYGGRKIVVSCELCVGTTKETNPSNLLTTDKGNFFKKALKKIINKYIIYLSMLTAAVLRKHWLPFKWLSLCSFGQNKTKKKSLG